MPWPGQHIDGNKDASLCMFVGCNRKGLFRNPNSAASNRTKRGYCRVHREMAVVSIKQSSEDWAARVNKSS